MKNYDIKQIDYLREKTGTTYEEAIELMDRFDGDLARCLVELERDGRLRARGAEPHHNPFDRGDRRHGRPAFVLDGEGAKGILFSRILVRRGDTVISNLTVLFSLFVLLCAPWVMIVAIVLAFLGGCRVKWVKGNRAGGTDFGAFVGHAAENIRRTADSVATAVSKRAPEESQAEPEEAAPAGADADQRQGSESLG
jgi:hypothetical protein